MLSKSRPHMVFMVNEEYRNKHITLVVVEELDLGYHVRKDNSQGWCRCVYVGGQVVLNRGSANTPLHR